MDNVKINAELQFSRLISFEEHLLKSGYFYVSTEHPEKQVFSQLASEY